MNVAIVTINSGISYSPQFAHAEISWTEPCMYSCTRTVILAEVALSIRVPLTVIQ